MAFPLLPGNLAMMFFIAIGPLGVCGGEVVVGDLAAVQLELRQDVGL